MIFARRTDTGMDRNKSKGFTLLELLVVVAIIGVLATIAIPMYRGYVDKAQKTVAVGTLDTMRKDLESFHIDYQRYPLDINFTTGREIPGSLQIFSSNMINQIASDFSTILTYIYNASIQSYTITTTAKDQANTPMTLTPQEITY